MDNQAKCAGCRNGDSFAAKISMAFQPIVDIHTGRTWAYEALVRGAGGEGAQWVLDQVTDDNRYAFDQRCRVVAIRKAVEAGILDTDAKLSINFLPNAVYSPLACIQLTLQTAREVGMPTDRLIFEFTEGEQMADPAHVANIVASYRAMGFGTALDDFGAGHAGLALLARFQTDEIKIDRELVTGIDISMPRRMIVEAIVGLANRMGLLVVAEGIETVGEYETLAAIGVRYMQGYLLARPAFETLPAITIPVLAENQALTA